MTSGSRGTPPRPRAAEPPPAPPRLELDPVAARLISDAISAAISAEMKSVRSSSTPPPRSSIRVAANATGKVSRWVTMAVGVLAFIGQIIVWTSKPEYAAPIGQALKLIVVALHVIPGSATPAIDPEPPAPPARRRGAPVERRQHVNDEPPDAGASEENP